MQNEGWVSQILDGMRAQHLERSLRSHPETGGKVTIDGREYLNFSSNDYLGLAHHPEVIESSRHALMKYGAGGTAARLVTGNLPLYTALEEKLAQHKGYPAALVFGSGYMTNAGTISALVDKDDLVFADRLVHASVLDAITLSRARLFRFQHNDTDHLQHLLEKNPTRARRLVVTESVFSMDGDVAPLEDIVRVARASGAMIMIDEAHATGVFGPGGSGLVRALGLQQDVNISMGTMSKALGCYGGFVACSEALREYLIGRARSFIYTTALPPATIGAALGALQILEENPDMGTELLARTRSFRDRLSDAGLNVMDSQSQIVPVWIGNNAKALALSARLWDRDIMAVAMRPPTVPPESSRLRLSITLAHSPEDLDDAAEAIIDGATHEGII